MLLAAAGFSASAAAQSDSLSRIVLPDGFSISVFADDVPGARSLAQGAAGTVFVGTRSQGRVYAVTDTDGDGEADRTRTLASGLTSPNGVAFRAGDLYVAEISRILRYEDIESKLDSPPTPVVVTASLPSDTSHGWKFIRFGPDGKLHVPVGAPCNICKRDDPYAAILRLAADGSYTVVARGVRNTVGFDWHPKTKKLWFTENGRDWLGDDAPPDELNVLTADGQHFGYPFCHGGDSADPTYGSERACSEFVAPARKLGPHVAALGMRFYTGSAFPERYRGQIFIAEHGSWNRTSKIGYRISLVRLGAGGSPEAYETFASGWLQGESAWGRPVDVMVRPDGSLLVSDDSRGDIYRIVWTDPTPNAAPEPVGELADLKLRAGGAAGTVDVSGAFRDAEDELTYTASSSDDQVATASVSGSRVSVAPVSAGTAAVTVTASEEGQSADRAATQTFDVTVAAMADVSVSFGSPAYRVAEGETVTVEVALSADPERDVTIPLVATYLGGATAADHEGLPRAAAFGDGQTRVEIAVTAVDDAADDDGEAVKLSFGELPHGVVGGGSTTLTIDDNDIAGGGDGGGGGGGGGGGVPPPDDDDDDDAGDAGGGGSDGGDAPPEAAIAVDAACAERLCRARAGDPIRFEDASTGAVRRRRWDFGDGRTSSIRAVDHAWSEPGFHKVGLWVSDGERESTASLTFLVEAADPAGTCAPDGRTLCLRDSRYAVTARWWTASGSAGVGSVAHAGTNDSGLFWFFDTGNWELLVKLLDGCEANGKVWVFGASTTDLGYAVRVTDTVTGLVKEYRNEPGSPANAIADATAFPEGCGP